MNEEKTLNVDKKVRLVPNGKDVRVGEPKLSDASMITVQDIMEFIDAARRLIMPFNQLAYETILNVVELAVIRDVAANDIVGLSEVHRDRDRTLSEDIAKILGDVEDELAKKSS